jgi:glucosamine--fructose-6-phosphate aminotransferase (isomerizing)
MVMVRMTRRIGRVGHGDAATAAYPPAMDVPDFDPTAPLPGPPDPWSSTDMPSRRGGPPFHMTEMIEAEPGLAARILSRQAGSESQASAIAEAIRTTLAAGQPVVVTGCGTSEHGALGVTEILREATGSPLVRSEQAFELSLDRPASGLVIGISHEGSTAATNAALEAARGAGARTALITVSQRSPGGARVDLVLETHEVDQSWCHTVGYLSPIVAGAAIAGHLGGAQLDPAVASAVVAAGLQPAAQSAAERLASGLASSERVIVIASGADRIAGRELVLKIEEGAWIPASYRDLETFLHGHLAATGPATGLVAIATDRRGGAARAARLSGALAAARVIGMPTAAIVTEAIDAQLPADRTSLGRIVVPDAPGDVPAAAGALLTSATPLQLLTERLARAQGVDPDPIHRDVEAYRAAAEAAERG